LLPGFGDKTLYVRHQHSMSGDQMNEILYDIFIRGVIPLCIVGVVGYIAKSFFDRHKGVLWTSVRRILMVSVWFVFTFFIYEYFASDYLKEYLPGETSLIGANVVLDSQDLYWKIEPNTTFSIPLFVRSNRIHTMRLHFLDYPVFLVYLVGQESHSLVLKSHDEPLFSILLEDFIHSQSLLSKTVNMDGEKILYLRMKTEKPNKLFSFQLNRSFPRYLILTVTGIESFLLAIALVAVDFLFSFSREAFELSFGRRKG
jgi:hypothetical protein